MFLYTDGLSEAFNEKREIYGVEKTKSLLFSDLKRIAHSFLNLVREDLRNFTGEKSLDDDISLVVAQTRSESQAKWLVGIV